MAMHKKSFTVDVPAEVSTAFTDHVDLQGFTKWRAIAGALKGYMAMPSDVQVFLNSPDTTVKQARKRLAMHYENAAKLNLLSKLSPEEQNYLVKLAKETTERLLEKR